MQAFFALLPQFLFAPPLALETRFLDEATDLADRERREASLEAQRRENVAARH